MWSLRSGCIFGKTRQVNNARPYIVHGVLQPAGKSMGDRPLASQTAWLPGRVGNRKRVSSSWSVKVGVRHCSCGQKTWSDLEVEPRTMVVRRGLGVGGNIRCVEHVVRPTRSRLSCR